MKPRNTLFGTSAMTGASALRVAIQVAILPIIGRLLGPHAYGQIALVSPFIVFSMIIAESGLGTCIVRAEHLTKELEGTVFCFSGFFSLIIITAFVTLAYPLGTLLHEPTFPTLLMAMSSVLLFASCNIVPAALLLRTKKYEWIALSDIASTIGGVAAVTTGIMLGWGVWSLVAQQIIFWICKVAVVMIGSRWHPHFIFKRDLIGQNIKFGANLTGSTILSFIARNIDNILIGAFMGSEVLGYYALAFQIVGLPQMVLSSSVYFTIFSKTSEAHREGKSSSEHFLKILRGFLLISMPAMIGLAVTAPLSVPLLLGDKWTPTVMLLMLLTPLGLCQTMGAAIYGVIIGIGRSDIPFKIGLLSSTATILAILIGVMINSSAVAIGVSITAIFGTFLGIRAISKECKVSFGDIGKAVAAPLISSLLMGFAVVVVARLLPASLTLTLQLAISIVAGIITYMLFLFGLFRDHIAADIALIKAVLFKRPQGAEI